MSWTDWDPIPKLCPRCLARGTHYLTCLTLALPAGYSVLADGVAPETPEPLERQPGVPVLTPSR